MDILCERCGARIPAEDVELQNRLARCRSCHAVFDFTAQIARPAAPAPASAPLAVVRPPAPRPEGITVVEDVPPPEVEAGYRTAPARGGRLVMRRSWYSHGLLFLAVFCLFWDGFLVNWYRIVLGADTGPGLLFFVFPLIHVAVGVGLTYRTLAGFLNKTWITVTADEVTVRHGPLPWFGNLALSSADIQQLYCEQSVSRGKNGTGASYRLSAVLRDGRSLDLLRSLSSAAEARYLEQRIEERLGIEDAPVAGELQR